MQQFQIKQFSALLITTKQELASLSTRLESIDSGIMLYTIHKSQCGPVNWVTIELHRAEYVNTSTETKEEGTAVSSSYR